MAKELEKLLLAHLWDRIGITVENVVLAPRQHRGNVTFCGYADFILWVFAAENVTIPLVRLVGNSIKLMGDQLHFDPKSERGKGTRSNEFFPHWLPAGGESRYILTRKLSELPEIQQMIHNTRAKLAQTGGSA